MDLSGILEAVGTLGLTITLALGLWYALLVPRKGDDGKKKSSLLVPGWKHDQDLDEIRAEVDRTRVFYEGSLKIAQDQANVRIAEWRGFRDEAVAQAADADDDRRRLLEAVTSASHDIALLLELQRMADRDGSKSGAARGKG